MFYNLKLLTTTALASTQECMLWMQREGLMLETVPCQVCQTNIKHVYIKGGTHIQFRCKKKDHCFAVTATAKTFFEGTKALLNMVVLVYFFSQNIKLYEFLSHECSADGFVASQPTICRWLSSCREACLYWLYKQCDRERLLGGAGVTVEVDLCRIGMCKFNFEPLTEGTWVLGLIEHNQSQRQGLYRLEVCSGEIQDAEELLKLSAKYCRPKTKLVASQGGEYLAVTVDNSQALTPYSTQLLKPSWLAKKASLTQRKTHMATHLAEFIYRREAKLSGIDSFAHFLQVIQAPFPS